MHQRKSNFRRRRQGRPNEERDIMSSKQEEEDEKRKVDGEAIMLLAPMDHSINEEAAGDNDVNPGEGKIRCTDFSSLKIPFPWKLWQLLEDSEKNGNQSIVSWLLDGDGFSISKPNEFTSDIMKAYFALTTYDSFIQELLKFGFVRTTEVNDMLKRVDVFRHPRYSRKEKKQSLAIRRRRYVVQSFSARLRAKFLKEHPQHGSTGGAARPPSSSDQEEGGDHSQNPAGAFTFFPRNSRRRPTTQAVKGEVKNYEEESLKNHVASILLDQYDATRHGVIEAGDIAGKQPFGHGERRNVVVKYSPYMDDCGNRLEGGQPRGTNESETTSRHNSSSISKMIDQSLVESCVPSSLPQLDDLDEADPLVSTYNPHNERYAADSKTPAIDYEGWVALTKDENDDEVQGGGLGFETNSSESLSSQTSVGTANTTLTKVVLQVSSSHVPTVSSELSKLFDDVQEQPDLENILDGDAMDSIFD